MKLTATLLATFVAGAFAECHNGCSGHGECTNYEPQFMVASATAQSNQLPAPTSNIKSQGYDITKIKKDTCTCFSKMEDGELVYAFQAADCSQMTCAYGQSWDAPPDAVNSHNIMAECSDRGICNRKNGECDCFPGYEGKGCRRTTCPNDCSSHGVCRTVHELTKLMSENTLWDTFSGFNYLDIKYDTAWDSDRIRGCDCDAGYRGADCSIKEAPSGPDPLGGPGAEAGRECSGRGVNDGNGECICHVGFFNTKCGEQRANSM